MGVRVLVFGAGAIGGLLAARLSSHTDADVWALGRPAFVKEVATHGLTIAGNTRGMFRLRAISQLPSSLSVDYVFLTVKSYDVREAGFQIGSWAIPCPPVLALENGLDIEEEWTEGLVASGATVRKGLYRGVNTIPVLREGPGRLFHSGEGEIRLGMSSEDGEERDLSSFAHLLEEAGFSLRRVPDISREIWRKLLVNAAINPVTAIHDLSNGELRKNPWRAEARLLWEEARQVAAVQGHLFLEEEIEKEFQHVVRNTAANLSSMLQDVRRGHRTEVEAISGALLRRGRAHGLSLPATQKAYDWLMTYEKNRQETPKPAPL